MAGRRQVIVASVVAVVTSAAYLTAVVTRPGSDWTTDAIADLGALAASAAATWACWRAARRSHRPAAWRALALGCGAWSLGEVVWTWNDLVTRSQPFPSPADAGFLLLIPFGSAAMVLALDAAEWRAGQLRVALDGAIVTAALLFVSWSYVLGPSFHERGGSLLAQVVSLAYPAGDLVALALAVMVIGRGDGRERGPFTLVAIGFGLLAIADSGFAWLQLVGAYSSGHPIDAGWFSGFAVIAVGATAARGRTATATQTMRTSTNYLSLATPYVPVVLAGLAALDRLSSTVSPFLLWNGVAVVILVIARQLTALVENVRLARSLEAKVQARTAELAIREERFRSLVQTSSDVIFILDDRDVITYVSPSIERVLGSADVEGRTVGELLADPEGDGATAVLATARTERDEQVREWRFRRADGAVALCEVVVRDLRHVEGVGGVVLNTRDVTERRELERELAHRAFHDPLTELPNRALLLERFDDALQTQFLATEPVAAVLVDLDGFKEVNDLLGHRVGDRVLAEVALRLRGAVRSTDLVARLGGDEFCVLVHDATESAVATTTSRISAAMAVPLVTPERYGAQMPIGVSMGVAVADDGMTADAILSDADLALYAAKAAGRGRAVVFEPSMRLALEERVELEAQLRRALEREDELVVHLQPVVDLATGRAVGAEALVRWQHPERGLLPPATFVPLAEATGLIVPLGRAVLREACAAAVDWPLGPDAYVAVNLSPRQFRHPSLVADVAACLAATGLPPGRLLLEITETVVTDDVDAAAATLRLLSDLGAGVALDDFGTGYSSLGYLSHFPVDVLKVDRSFVHALSRGDERSRAVVRAVVELARAFGLSTIAEGIETEDQLEALRALGCASGQGFLFARPAPVDQLAPTPVAV